MVEHDKISKLIIKDDCVIFETFDGKRLVVPKYVFTNIKRDIQVIDEATVTFPKDSDCKGCGK